MRRSLLLYAAPACIGVLALVPGAGCAKILGDFELGLGPIDAQGDGTTDSADEADATSAPVDVEAGDSGGKTEVGVGPDASQDTTAPGDGPLPTADASDAADAPSDAPAEGPPSCNATQQLCDGACVALNDPKHCWSCTHDCTALQHVNPTGTVCQGGVCVVACNPPFGHCTMNADDGCETDQSQTQHCGACTTVCGATDPVCAQAVDAGYACATGCSSPNPDLCSGTCTNLQTDPQHCGACATACQPPTNSTSTCANGACGFTCLSGYHACSNACASNTATATCGSRCSACPTDPNFTATCDGTNCAESCNAPFSLCTGNVCTNLQSDGKNCGSCGHDCLGGGCVSGACQPTTLATVSSAFVEQMATDGANMFFTANASGANGGIYACASAGCGGTPTKLIGGIQNPRGIFYDRTNNLVWFTNEENPTGTVEYVTPSGANHVVWQQNLANPVSIATDGTTVFFAGGSGLEKALFSSAASTSNSIANLSFPWIAAVDNTNVYVADRTQNLVAYCAKGSSCTASPPTALISGVNTPVQVIADGTNVWVAVTGAGTVYKCSMSSCGSPLIAGLASAEAIAIDGTNVYASSASAGTIVRCSVNGCSSPTVIATGQQGQGIEVDSVAVYWTNGNAGTVMRLAK